MMQSAGTVLLLAVLVAPQAPPAGQPPRPTSAPVTPGVVPALDAEYRIGPEDVLSIVVIGQPDYTRTVPVRPDGRISLPMVNDVMAAGLTPGDLRLALMKSFEKFIRKDFLEVSVIVTEVHSIKVSVQGQVRTPIRFEMKSRVNILEALAMAGGFTDYAKKDRIIVRRADGSILTFNYDRFLERPEATEIIVLRGGDNIIVP